MIMVRWNDMTILWECEVLPMMCILGWESALHFPLVLLAWWPGPQPLNSESESFLFIHIAFKSRQQAAKNKSFPQTSHHWQQQQATWWWGIVNAGRADEHFSMLYDNFCHRWSINNRLRNGNTLLILCTMTQAAWSWWIHGLMLWLQNSCAWSPTIHHCTGIQGMLLFPGCGVGGSGSGRHMLVEQSLCLIFPPPSCSKCSIEQIWLL